VDSDRYLCSMYHEGKVNFLNWFGNIDIPDDHLWIILGDFNLIRRPENRNKPGGDNQIMQLFNEAISNLGLTKIPLSGKAFTWSNRQQNPLLERLDWFFISQAWSVEFSGTKAKTLTRDVLDHVPCAVMIQLDISKPKIFRFEIFLLERKSFHTVFKEIWALPGYKTDPALKLTSKLKTSRKCLKDRQKSIPKLATTIDNTKLVIQFRDLIEESRDLEIHEWNFRDIL
jgi:hypothetical protein